MTIRLNPLPKSGRTKEEEDRRKAQQQNAAAKKKKTQKKNTAKKKQNAKKDDRKTESSKALGLRLPSVYDSLPTLSKEDQKTAVEQMRSRMDKAEKRNAEKQNYRKNTNDKRYNPLIRSATPLVPDSSPKIDNLAEATVRKGAQGFEGALVGYSDRRNMKRAEDLLTGEYNNRFVPGVKGGVRMQVDDPMQVRRAEAEAKKAGFNSVEEWEIAKANELIRANDDFYRRKEALDEDVNAQGYTGIKKHIPEIAEQIGSMIPTMAVGAASGGIGAAAGLTGGAAWALNTVLTGGEIGGRVSGSESRQVYNALAAQYGKEMTREQMIDAIQKANTTGELVGIAEAGTEALFGGLPFVGKGLMDHAAAKVGWEVLNPATRQSIQAWRNTTTGRIFTQVAERTGGAIGEGVEEAIMTLAQPAIESSVAGLESDVTLNDILHDFGMGAAVSLVLGIPVSAVETTSAAVDGVRSRDAKNEMMALFENRFKEMVSAGQLTPEEAKTKVQEVNDILSGRGSLNVNDVQSETKTDSDTKEVYTDLTKAKEALETKAKGREIGEEVSVAVVENGVAETWKATVTENGIEKMQLGTTTEEEQQAYLNKAQKMETATNEAERTGYQFNVKEDIINEVSALSKAFGKDIEFVATDGAVHGYVDDNGKISVNINSSESPARAVIAHEMTHLLENTASYGKLMDLVAENYGSSLDSKREEIKANYEAAGHPLEDSEVDYELMAHFVEEKLLTDKATVQKLLQKDRSIGQKILDWINNIIQKITGTKEQRMLMDARDLWNKALAENKKAPESGAEKRFSFGGEKAKTADKGALETAKGMRAEGKDPEEIYRETGWFVGADGKWRFEISNDDLELKIVGFITRQDTIVDLGDVIESEKLFSAYPDLAWLTVEFRDIKNGYAGAYYPNNDSIEISYDTFFKDREIFKDVLVHEIQHAIQRRESFARGSSEEYWKKQIENGFDSRRKEDIEEEERLQKEYDKYRKNNYDLFRDVTELEASMPNVPRGAINWDTLEQIEEDPVEWQEYDARRDELAEKYGHNALIDLSEIIRKLNNVRKRERTPKELYRSTAGEIEADDVAYRRDLTEAQRRDRFPMNSFIYRDVVFADGNGRSGLLVGYTKDGRSVYTSSFPESMTRKEKEKEFEERLATIFNLGAVELNVKVKKIEVLGDKIVAGKTLYGDGVYRTNPEKRARVDLLYDYADILRNAEFIKVNIEDSYADQTKRPKNPAHKDVKYWYKFKNNIVLDDVGYQIVFNIRDKGKEQYVYQIEIKKDGTSAQDNTAVKGLLPREQISHKNIISDSSEKSNTKFSIGRSDIADKELRDLIKTENRKMKDVFFIRSTVDRNALWDMIYDEEKHIAETGSYRRNVVQDIIDYAYETGYRTTKTDKEVINSWGRQSIYIPEKYRGEMDTLDGLAEVNRRMAGSGIAFTYKNTGGALDDAYRTLREENPGLMPDTVDPSEQVEIIKDLFGSEGSRETLRELDDEAWEDFGQEDRPFYTDIEQTVYGVMEELSAISVARMIDDTRASAQETISKMEKVLQDAETQQEYTEKEKAKLKEKIDATKKEAKAELKQRAQAERDNRKQASKSLSKIAKEYEKGNTEKAKELVAEEQKRINPKYRKSDKVLRQEHQDKIVKEYFKNKENPEAGSSKATYLRNNSVKNIAERFRRETITQLVNNGKFAVTNENVILDENGAEIAVRKDDMWEFSEHKNTYTPYFGITLLAQKEGINVDQFFTMYSKIQDIKTQPQEPGRKVNKRSEVVSYINSLNLNKRQKEFLYFEVAKYATSTMPNFLAGGRVNEEKGNLRGRMFESLDNITFDMFKGHMKEDSRWASEMSPQIRQKDINDFVEMIYGKEDSKEKDDFLDIFTRMIVDYSEEMETVRLMDKANLLVNKPKETDPLKVKIVRSYREAKQNFLCEGEAFERMADKMNNPLIKARYYQAKSAVATANEMINGKHQRNLSGELMGKSLYQIFEPVFKADTKAKNSNGMELLTELINNRHDIYRQKYDKGYTGNTVEECETIVENISTAHPELLKVADELVEYGRNLLKMCVECGILSQEGYDNLVAKYPYYVPAYRLQENEMMDRSGKIKRDTAVIKKARFGNRTVLPLWDQMVRRTNEIVKACKKNQLAFELVRATQVKGHEDFVSSVTKTIDQGNMENAVADLGQIEDIGKARRTQEDDTFIPWYCNGEKFDVDIADASLLYGWDRINYRMDEKQYHRVLRRMNSFRRAVLTQYNPTFWLTNHIRDISDMFLYNQHAHRLIGYLSYAYAEMFGGKATSTKAFQKAYKKATGKDFEYDESKADALERYLSKGASQASIFEYDNTNAGRKTTTGKVISYLKKPLEAFDSWNFMFEQIPRLAVFNETVDRLTEEKEKGKNDYTEEEIDTIAAYQAADATLNFGRSGTVVKNLNTYGCTFLNAGVQGMDRARRMFTQVKDGNKKILFLNLFGLIFKIFVMGFSAHIIIEWLYKGTDEAAKAIREALYGDDEEKVMQEYAEMSDYQHMNYILVNIKGEWIRIPQGRLAAFLYSFGYNGEKVAIGESDALDLVAAQWDMAKETVLFGNPVTNNVFGPIIDANLRNKDAWGNDIVSEYEDMGDGFHYLEYDEKTTQAAIKAAQFGHWLTAEVFGKEQSRILDFSPKKLDYVVKQYFGSYANLLTPFLNGTSGWKEKLTEGLSETIFKKFYVNPVESNRLAGDYYDLKEEYENIANAHDNDSPYAVAKKVFDENTDQLKYLREQITLISNDYEISSEERAMQILDLREQINTIYRQSVADAENALAYAKSNYTGKDDNGDIYDEWAKGYYTTEWRIGHFNKTEKKKFTKLTDAGCSDETAVSIMDGLSGLEPLEGKDQVSDYQRMELIASYDLPADQENAAVSAVMTGKSYAKYLAGAEYGLTAQIWCDYENALKQADADNNGNGSYDKDEKEAAALMLDVSNSIRAVLWQSKDTSIGKTDKTTQWKAARNPFGSGTASKMIDSYMKKIATLEEGELAENNAESKQYLPLSADYRISSEYGVDRGDHTHSGIDLAVPEGSEVATVKEGTVSYAGWMGGYGYRVVVDHPDGTQTAYSHLSDIGVRVDDEVTAGTIIALSGNTGNSSGPHLHFEIKVDGSYVNPEEYFDFGNGLKAPGSSNYVSQMSAVKSSGGSSSGNGGGSSSGSRSGGGYASSYTSRVASVRTSNQGYINSSGNIVLPRAGGSSGGGSAPVTGRSTKAPTYAAKGLTLPKASDYSRGTQRNIGATSVATTQRTGRTGGSLWDPDVI